MKTVYFVRHGEALHNVIPGPERFLNADDACLTERGHAQAAFIGTRARALDFDLLISSTYKRAHQTAEYISTATGTSITTSPLFIELREPTSFRGENNTDPAFRERQKLWHASTFSSEKYEDGENFDDITNRARDALAFLAAQSEDSILVTTHGMFLRWLYGYAAFGDALTPQIMQGLAWSMRTANTGLSIFRYDPDAERAKWWVWVWNDHAHLGE